MCLIFFCSYSCSQPKQVHPAFSESFHFRRHWLGWCFSSILWRKDNESGTDKSCSPHGTGWRRLDYVMGKSVFMYF